MENCMKLFIYLSACIDIHSQTKGVNINSNSMSTNGLALTVSWQTQPGVCAFINLHHDECLREQSGCGGLKVIICPSIINEC